MTMDAFFKTGAAVPGSFDAIINEFCPKEELLENGVLLIALVKLLKPASGEFITSDPDQEDKDKFEAAGLRIQNTIWYVGPTQFKGQEKWYMFWDFYRVR